MVQKPLSVARREYMDSICQITNKSGLPTFVIAEVLEKALAEVNKQTESEYKADMARYRAALMAENETDEQGDGEIIGRQKNQ